MTLIRALIRRLCRTIVAWLDRTEPVQCTGVSAAWCPVCGDCTCPDRSEAMNDYDCPLHGEHSKARGGREVSTPDDLIMQHILSQKVVFGLAAQGHIPTIERMLAEGKSWQEIGAAIGWDPETAKRHYEWHIKRAEGGQ